MRQAGRADCSRVPGSTHSRYGSSTARSAETSADAPLAPMLCRCSSTSVEDFVCDTSDDPEQVIRWGGPIKVDEGEHGGLGIAPASHGTFSWATGVMRPLYPANVDNETSDRLFPQPASCAGIAR